MYGAAVVALSLAGCSATADANHDADAKALKDNETQWNQDFVSRDAEKLAAHYADDAVLIGPGMPSIPGKEAIRKALTAMVADPALSLRFESSRVEIGKAGDIAFMQGSYRMTMTDPNSKQVIHDHGSYVTTYRKQPDGSWKAVADIASSEIPPGSPSDASPTK
jgi:uncharacterized protein (TIGR02246 family)